METIADLLAVQCDLFSRRQLVARGSPMPRSPDGSAAASGRSVHDGVYVDHTGALSWIQRAWAAVLFSWPAALSHDSALRAGDGPGRRGHEDGEDGLLHVARRRNLVSPEGVRIHRRAGFEPHVLWHLGPSRVRYEYAALDVAAAVASDFDAVGVLARAVQSRRTTARRLRHVLAGRQRVARPGAR